MPFRLLGIFGKQLNKFKKIKKKDIALKYFYFIKLYTCDQTIIYKIWNTCLKYFLKYKKLKINQGKCMPVSLFSIIHI